MAVFERLVSRNIAVFLSNELDLAGMKTTVERFVQIAILGGIVIFVLIAFYLTIGFMLNPAISVLLGIGAVVLYELILYVFLEFRIDERKNFVETILPDYLQITAANVRSGISLDKAMLFAARPEFKYFSEDVKLTSKSLYAGETLQNTLTLLASRYRSLQLKHTIRMMNEAIQYGGGMTDLLNQVAKDLRNQGMIQKEISGQLFMYTIFIAFAALVGAPVLYALTNQMMSVTITVWAGILKQNPGGLPTAGVSFLKPSPPQITAIQYQDFAIGAILVITGFGSFIVSAISTGSPIKGLKYFPIFIVAGIIIFFLVSSAMGGLFSSISGT